MEIMHIHLAVTFGEKEGRNLAVKVKLLSRVGLCDAMDCSYQAPLSMGFSRREYWSGVPSCICSVIVRSCG